MSVTLHFQSTGTIPGNARPVSMSGRSMTLGRGDDNDLVLPDPQRMISKHHCAIEDQGGNVVVIDYSTNGTFLNYGKMPLGKVPTPLNDGDILTMGPYELLVEIRQAQRADPLADIPPPLDEPAPRGVGGQALPPGGIGGLLDDGASEGDFLDDLLGGAQPTGPKGLNRPEVGDDGLLPPLGEEGDPLAPLPESGPREGASQGYHSPSSEDSFQVPRAAAAPGQIPDDWDIDLTPGGGGGGGAAAIPDDPLRPAAPQGGDPIPDDFLSDLAPQLPVAAEPEVPEPMPEPEAVAPQAPPTPEAAPPETAPAVPHSAEATAPPPRPRPAQAAPKPPSEALAPDAPAAAGGGDAAARAFLKALGAEQLSLPDAELEETMARLGGVLRVMIEGVREVLMTRASIKSEFRINRTMISAGGNNPLKFSVSPEQAIEAMVKPTTRGYLDAATAARQAIDDIKAHEVASMTGMEAALKGVLVKLDPAVLEGRLSEGGGIGDLIKGRKARYWELYEKLYAEIADQAENDFQELFAKEFARAYQDQLERLK